MEALVAWKLKDGRKYDQYFPKPSGRRIVIEKNADLGHTMRFIPEAVKATLSDTQAVSHAILKGRSLRETCRNIWYFIKEHVAYQRDQDGKEEIRRPSRLWWDKIGDCDCFTVFISSVLTNLKIRHLLRVTQYDPSRGFQHIYPIVPIPGSNDYYTVDCVVNRFDYEEPYDLYKDQNMELHFLDGTPGTDLEEPNIDASDLFGGSDLGKLKILQKVKQGVQKAKEKVHNVAVKVGTGVQKGLHVINRVNPATVLLRTGVLASMKLNMFGVAEKLRYAYLSDAQAEKQGIDMTKFPKLKNVRVKLEKIFYDAGGKPENLRDAILTGKGNRVNPVSLNGLGYVAAGYNQTSPLSKILGSSIYTSEITANDSLGELGDPATASALAASSGAMGIIAGLLKAIGNLFKKMNNKGDAPASDTTEADGGSGADTSGDYSSGDYSETDYSTNPADTGQDETGLTTDDGSNAKEASTGFLDKAKVWVSENKKTLMIAGGVIALAGGGYYLYNHLQKGKGATHGLSGTRKGKKRGRPKGGKNKFKVRELT